MAAFTIIKSSSSSSFTVDLRFTPLMMMMVSTISPSQNRLYFSTKFHTPSTNPSFTSNTNNPLKIPFDELIHTTPMPPIQRFNKSSSPFTATVDVRFTPLIRTISSSCCRRYYSTSHTPITNPNFTLNTNNPSEVFHAMIRTKPTPPIRHFNKLFAEITKMNHFPTCLSLIRQLDILQISNLRPDLYTCNIAINCFCKLNEFGFGFSVLGKIFKLGFEPSCITFNTLIRGLCLEGKLAQAVSFFYEAVNQGLQPDLVTYGTIIDGLCKLGNTPSALLLLQHMEQVGNCRPGVFQYSTIIDRLCKDKKLNDALKIFNDMIVKRIMPDVVTYNTLIHGLCTIGQSKEAASMLGKMIRTNISPNVRTYSVIIDALGKEGKAEKAHQVLHFMIQIGAEPDVITYSSLMDGYCLLGKADEATKILKFMRTRGCLPGVYCYSILIDGYCKTKRLNEAFALFQEMCRVGLIPDMVTYTTLIGGLCYVGRPLDACKLVDEMQVKGYSPNIYTYSILLNCLCNEKRVEAERLHPNVIKVMNGSCKVGKMKEVNELMTKLKENGCSPDEKVVETGDGADLSTKELMAKLSTNDVLDDSPKKKLAKIFLD